MKDRLKEIRKDNNLNQQEFAEKIGINRGTLANYEVGRNEPIDAVIKLICDTFTINEKWLRTGEGPKKADVSENDEIQRLLDGLMGDKSAEVKRRLVTAILRLDADQIEAGINWMRKTLAIVDAYNHKNPADMNRDELHAELDRQIDTVEEGAKKDTEGTA